VLHILGHRFQVAEQNLLASVPNFALEEPKGPELNQLVALP